MRVLTQSDKIKQFFPRHNINAVGKFLLLINIIIQSRTVCLYKCRDKIPAMMNQKDQIKPGSNYMLLIRFFKIKRIEEFIEGVCQLLISIAQVEQNYLIIDRTNWKIGVKNVNLLTIGGLWQNAFLPLQWLQLDKRGNSNVEDRKKLLDKIIGLFEWAGKTVKGLILLADREFIGTQWLEYLLSKEISFVIRLRENMYGELATITGKKNFAQVLMQIRLRRRIYAVPMSLQGHLYTFVIMVNPKKGRSEEPFLFFISDLKDAKAIANHYLKRWKIECCFKHLKKNGFNIEDINLKADDKIQLMMGILACTYLMAIMEGIIKQADSPVKMKVYKKGNSYPLISLFRRGYIELQKIFTTLERALDHFTCLLKPIPITVSGKNSKSV